MHNTKSTPAPQVGGFSWSGALLGGALLGGALLGGVLPGGVHLGGAAWAAPTEPGARDSFVLTFPKPEEDDLDAARELYRERCERCHGRDLRGDGPLSQGLSPRPQDLTRSDWFGRVPHAERLRLLRRAVVGGGLAIGQSALMPANPDLRGRPKLLYALLYLIAAQHVPSAQHPAEESLDGHGAPPPREAPPREAPPREAPPSEALPRPARPAPPRGAPPRSL